MKFKSKTLLIDNDEDTNFNDIIRPCDYNYARMNSLELMYCRLFMWKSIQRNIKGSFDELVEGLKQFLWHIWDLSLVPFLPITLYIYSKREIEKAKIEVWKDKCYDCKYWKSSPIIKGRVEDIIGIDECIQCKLIDGMPTKFVESNKVNQ